MARSRLLNRAWISGALVIALAGCQTVRPVPVTLPLPPRPVLTPVTASQVQCLAPATYTALVTRERQLRTYALELEAIIKAANAKAGKLGASGGQ